MKETPVTRKSDIMDTLGICVDNVTNINSTAKTMQARMTNGNEAHTIENDVNTILRLSKETASILRVTIGCVNNKKVEDYYHG